MNSAWDPLEKHFAGCNVLLKKKNGWQNADTGTKNAIQAYTKCAFELRLKIKIISLFSLLMLLFISPIALFSAIYELHYTILTNFYLYLSYF